MIMLSCLNSQRTCYLASTYTLNIIASARLSPSDRPRLLGNESLELDAPPSPGREGRPQPLTIDEPPLAGSVLMQSSPFSPGSQLALASSLSTASINHQVSATSPSGPTPK